MFLTQAIAQAQTINLSDSLSNVFSVKPRPTASFNTLNSFITGKSAKIFDVRAGFSWNKSFKLGLGYHWLQTSFVQQHKEESKTYDCEIKFRYLAPFANYVYYKKGPWEASVDLNLGFGKSFLRFNDGNTKIDFIKKSMVVYEATMTIEYKVLNLIAIGGGYGYRVLLKGNREMHQQFSAPVYQIGIRLIFEEVYKRAKAAYRGSGRTNF